MKAWMHWLVVVAGASPAWAAPPPAAPPSAGAAAAPPMAASGAPAAAAGGVHFQVIDETDPQEISEDTVIFINGVQVAHFKLDRTHAYSVADVVAPAKGPYDYALCGRITVALPDGQPEQRVVDGGATLSEVAGHTFRALAAADFTVFYLADAQAGPAFMPKDAHHTDACSLPVS